MSPESIHGALLADAVLHIRATAPDLAALYRDYPIHRATLWALWSREEPDFATITPEARERVRAERTHHHSITPPGQCHGRGFRGAA